ncbi:MAG: OmpA family protein [Terracidiphilus sp.]|jgi:outer membrane protein OmpA-like peptidoglycan-associated protein
MNRMLRSTLLVLIAVMTIPFAFSQTDKAGSKDYPGITRMPGYYIDDYEEMPFSSFEFTVTVGGKTTKQAVEGHWYHIKYQRKRDNQPVSAIQIRRNYQNAARAAGGQVLHDDGGEGPRTTVRITKGGSKIWVEAFISSVGPDIYILTIVEEQVMQQDVTMDASAMASSISDTGSVAIYGINFDTAKSDIKPESEPAIDEIAKLLKNNAALKVYIVGHTDMVGDAASNVKLSQARAQSVINDLVSKHSIAAARLIAFGNGPYAPVASNKTDEGRAKNRRVELVEIATK